MVARANMMQIPEQAVQGVQTASWIEERAPLSRDSLQGLEWDDLKLFLVVTEAGSLRSAAESARVAVNTVRSKIARLEDRFGEPLLTRSYDGVTLTPAGVQLRKVALTMRGVAVGDGLIPSGYLRQPNELRIGASEGLGSGWLTPRLMDLQGRFPHLTMALHCENDQYKDRSEELDIEVVWRLPRNPDLVVSKLATLHYMPYASIDYVRQYGIPQSPEDLLNHRIIEQWAPGVKSELLDQLVGTDRPPGFLPIRTNSSLAIFWAVANGVGIAFMPTYTSMLVNRLVPIDLPFRLKFDLFYYYHPEARSSEIVMAGVDWLKGCFDPKLYPWFNSNFIHPTDFKDNRGGNVVSMFDSLAMR